MAKILLASAHESVKQRFVEALTPDGHTFVLCDSGDRLRKSLLERLPDLMIADVDLPGLDAFELVEALQDLSGGRPIPRL